MALQNPLTSPKLAFVLSRAEWKYVFEKMPKGTKFRIMEDDDYWYYNVPPTMLGAIIDLLPQSEPRPKRRKFSRRKVQLIVKKSTFGFGAVLDEQEE